MRDYNMKPFSLFKRGKVWYCQFKKSDGTWTTARTTRETAKSRAEAWAIDYLQKNEGRIIDNNRVTFETFSNNFFSWDGEWALDKRATGKRLSERQCIANQKQVEQVLNPIFGHMKLTDIDRQVIKTFRNDLYKKDYSASYINKLLCNLLIILESAYDKNLISGLPKIDKVAKKIQKQKGILSIEQTKQLFSTVWPDFIAYTMNLTAAATGLRRGELLALQIKNFHDDYIEVDKSYDSIMKRLNTTTKNGRSRRVIVPNMVKTALKQLIRQNPYKSPDSFIFYSDTPDRPIHGEYVNNCLYRAMRDLLGIDEKNRKELNITFHSWRAAFNSWLINAHIPLAKVMSLTGHLSREMAEGVYFRPDDLQDVKQLQEDLFSLEVK